MLDASLPAVKPVPHHVIISAALVELVALDFSDSDVRANAALTALPRPATKSLEPVIAVSRDFTVTCVLSNAAATVQGLTPLVTESLEPVRVASWEFTELPALNSAV